MAGAVGSEPLCASLENHGPTSCFTGQAHRLPDAPEVYGAMIIHSEAAPPQSRYADLAL